MRTGKVLLLCLVLCAAHHCAVAQTEPNDDFASTIVLAPGVLTVSDSINASVGGTGPDTTLGAFNTSGGLIEVDDDSSPFGDGKASALVDVGVNSDGTIHLKVSGYPDQDFDGTDDYWPTEQHQETGAFDLHVTVLDGGLEVDSQDLSGTLTAGGVLSFDLAGYASSGSFNAAIDNTPSGDDDIADFWAFTGLTPDDHFEAEVTVSTFDPLLGLFDADGVPIEYDDDSGAGQLPRICGSVPAGGALNLAVTGYADVLFQGDHTQAGDYTLRIVTEHPGDATRDGAVDYLDLGIVATLYGQVDAEWDGGDFTHDGVVNYLDVGVVATEYGWSRGGGAGSVPEPATLALLALGAGVLLGRKRR